MKPTLLILAAGMGSRYGGLKQLDGVGPQGEAIIEFSVYDALRAGFGKVVFVIRKDIETAFREKLGDKLARHIEVAYAFQETNAPVPGIAELPPREKPWGTGHAVWAARELIQEPFAVINADDYYGVDSFANMSNFLQRDCSPSCYGMVGYVLGNTLSDHGSVSRGVCAMDDQNWLTGVTERHQVHRDAQGISFAENNERHYLPEETLVSMNFWGFHPNVFDYFEKDFVSFVNQLGDQPKAEFYIPLVINRLVHEKTIRLKVIPCPDQWYGVTYREDKPTVEAAFSQFVKQGIYPSTGLWQPKA